jgi:hypothetical protein
LLAGLFREDFRLLASEVESAFIGLYENKPRIKGDLAALSQSVKALNMEDEITLVIQQKINSILLNKCGMDLETTIAELP